MSFEQSKYLKGLELDTLTGLVSAYGIEQDPIPLDELSGLEEYVKRPDPNWSYSRVSECEEENQYYTIYCMKMYSQKWLDSSVWYSPTHQDRPNSRKRTDLWTDKSLIGSLNFLKG